MTPTPSPSPAPLPEPVSDSLDTLLIDSSGWVVDNTEKPTPLHVRRALAKKPWLFPDGKPPPIPEDETPSGEAPPAQDGDRELDPPKKTDGC